MHDFVLSELVCYGSLSLAKSTHTGLASLFNGQHAFFFNFVLIQSIVNLTCHYNWVWGEVSNELGSRTLYVPIRLF